MIGHESTDPPAKWHTPCPPLSILFYMGAVSPSDDDIVLWERVHLCLRDDFSAVARPHQRDYGMRCIPPGDTFRKKAALNIALDSMFFQKRSGSLFFLFSFVCNSPNRQVGRDTKFLYDLKLNEQKILDKSVNVAL